MIINGRNTRKNSLSNTNTKDLSYYRNLKAKAKQQIQPTISDVPKININDIAEQSRGGITSAQIRKQANLMQQERIRAEEAQKAREEAEWHAKTPIQKVGTVVGKTLATPVAAMGELGTGVARAFEGFMDLGITGGGVGIGAMRKKRLENSQIMRDKLLSEGKISQQEADEWQRKINEEKIQDQEIDKATAKAIEYPIAENLLGKANREFTEKYSYLPTKAADISKTVGTILPSIGTGSELMASKPLQALAGTGKFGSKLASTASMIPFMGQATGMSTEEALREGADLQSAAKYGVLSGVVEGTIEAISGGIGGTTSNKLISKLAPETISKISNKVIAKYLPKLLDAGIDLTGEGAEEWLSTFINPYIKRLTYDEKAELSTSEERMEAFIDGVLASMVLKGATSLSKRTTPEGRIEALPEIDINTQNQLANINKNIEYQKQNEALANKQIQESVQNAKNNIENSKTTLTLPEGNRFYADEKGNVVTAQNYVAPRGQVQNQNSPVNTKQTIVDAQNNSQNDLLRQINTTLPTQAEMAQKANTEQINTSPNLATQKAQKTYQSAKIAGMTDVDMKKAIDLNNMLRSGANLEFYDEKNIPQNVQADKAKIANGFYKDGTLWINKNSKNKVEQILGHELTHHLETTNSYTDLSNTILDSDVFYDYISEKGYTNVAEYKTKLKEMGYTDAQMNNEMVARFVEEKLFTDQNSIDRLARQNTKLVEKIKNWISDLVVSFKGTAQEKELLRIENMYRKALDQARNTTASTETQYSYSGEVGLQNLKTRYDKMNTMQKEFVNELENNYQKALYLSSKGYKNDQILKETGWFESDGKWKWEIPDEYFKLKDNANLSNGEHDLSEIIDHDLIFMVYPELAKQKVVVSNNAGRSFYNTINDKIYLKIGEKTRDAIELSLLHELQHSIQNIEGFDGGTSSLGGMLRYYEKHGEIEASDTVRRFKQSKNDASFDRENVAPELSKENPKHPMLDKYLAGETKKQTPIRDSLYQKSKEKGNGIYEKIDRKAFGMEVDEANNGKDMRVDNGGRTRRNVTDTAGKEPAFSMPETDNKGRTLSKEQQEFFKDSKVRDENGKLKTMYHFTNDTFNKIDFKKNAQGLFWFTDDKNALDDGNISAPGLRLGKDIIAKEMYVNMKKPAGYEEYDKYTIQQLKDRGYDGILFDDGEGTIIGAVFNNSNQIKNVDNTNPTENPDIRYSVNPVNIAKNPPNIETGLDQLNRAKRVKEGDSQSNFASNILNQSIFDEKFTNLALDDKNIRSYESISNKETLQEANDAINEQGQKWVDRFLDKPNGEMKATDIAGGFILMNRYQQVGDYESMIRVAEKLRKAGTQQGQTIQMFSVLGRMTPEGMTYYAQKELSKAYEEILKNKTQKWADEHADEFKLNDKDIEYIQRRVTQAAKLPEGRDKYVLLGEIASRIQNKIPPQAGQGLKALARNSMLLNPKTMVRNILGNVVIAPNHIVSDFIGSKIDESISKKTGIRTTGGFDVKALQGAKKGFYESFDDFRRKISTREMGGDRFEIGQGKNFYENHTGKFAETRNKINKALNGLDRVTGFLLEAGDRPFYETWFINSLNNQMKLNNVTEPTAEMLEIATDEALQRTWQDSNSYTEFVTNFRKGLNKVNIKGYGLGDIVMPFVKTPANLTKAVVDFSPLGAINAAVKTSQFNRDIGKGVATTKQQREVVKAWSQVITGTIGMAIMTAMANAGILGGGSDEDKDVRNFEQKILGIKPYSIKIGEKSYTYDWAQPLGTSAAMVADTVKSLKNAKDTEGKVAAALEGLQSGASVLLEQSFVSGIRQFFEEDGLISAIIEAIFNEPTKFTPQFLSQLAQLQDDTERVSFVYNNIPQTAKNKIKAKIPGQRQTLEPKVDVLGREVKTDNSVGNVMFNPANTAFARTTEGAKEMYRVYEATGDKAVIAQVAPYYFDIGSDKVVLTPKQITQYQKTIGKIASDGVEKLLDNKAYKNLSDVDKAEILKELYSYGNAIAKKEASNQYLMPKDMQKIKDSGMNPEEYILLKRIANSGGTKKEELYNSLTSAGYSKKQTESFLSYYKGYKFDDTINNTLPTLKQQRAKLPTLKK